MRKCLGLGISPKALHRRIRGTNLEFNLFVNYLEVGTLNWEFQVRAWNSKFDVRLEVQVWTWSSNFKFEVRIQSANFVFGVRTSISNLELQIWCSIHTKLEAFRHSSTRAIECLIACFYSSLGIPLLVVAISWPLKALNRRRNASIYQTDLSTLQSLFFDLQSLNLANHLTIDVLRQSIIPSRSNHRWKSFTSNPSIFVVQSPSFLQSLNLSNPRSFRFFFSASPSHCLFYMYPAPISQSLNVSIYHPLNTQTSLSNPSIFQVYNLSPTLTPPLSPALHSSGSLSYPTLNSPTRSCPSVPPSPASFPSGLLWNAWRCMRSCSCTNVLVRTRCKH